MAEFKGTREAFAAALYEMAAENDKVVGVFPDSLKAMRAVPFGETYPDRYIECGIAEQCAVDVAAGLGFGRNASVRWNLLWIPYHESWRADAYIRWLY